MKFYSLFLATLIFASQCQAAVIGSLSAERAYQVSLDSSLVETQTTSSEGTLTVALPQGMHIIAIASTTGREQNPTPTSTPDPDSDPTGRELFVAGFDETSETNRFEVLDSQGRSLTGSIEVLEGVNTPADIQATDLDGDEILEVVAAGFNYDHGVIVEFWSGRGERLSRFEGVFDSSFDSENFLMTGDFDGNQGAEAVLVGRDLEGGYDLKALNSEGSTVASFEAFAPGCCKIDSFFLANADGNGALEAVLFGQSDAGTVTLRTFTAEGLLHEALVFGREYEGMTDAFALDLNGDGLSEIAAVRKNSRTDSFRLLVLDAMGTILLKKNLLSGKFEDDATFTAADVDNDGRDEITASGKLSGTGENVIQIIDDNGSQMVARTVLDPSFDGTNVSLYVDIDGDGSRELVVGGLDRTSGMTNYQVIDSYGEVVASGLGAGSFSETEFLASDLSGDGTEDILIVVETAEGAFGIELHDGQGGQVQFQATVSSLPLSVSTGELL
jgi:hypothetical protein